MGFKVGDKVRVKTNAVCGLLNPPPGTEGIVISHKQYINGRKDLVFLQVQWPIGAVNPPAHMKRANNIYDISSTKVEKV